MARRLTRRELVAGALAGGAGWLAAGCGLTLETTPFPPGSGRIGARPVAPGGSVAPGLHHLDLGLARDGLFYVPASYSPGAAAPLALLLHGAFAHADELLAPMRALADGLGLVLVAPDARRSTWDIRFGAYGPDVSFIEAALRLVFGKVRADPARVTIAGFSDGASYALGLGRINGDLFRRIAAFSPGVVPPGVPLGRPAVFVTHGREDAVLPIDQTSRRIVPALRGEGYAVEYREFTGGHGITAELLAEATGWLAA